MSNRQNRPAAVFAPTSRAAATRSAHRMPFHLIGLAGAFGDLVIILLTGIAAGLGYHRMVLGVAGSADTFLAIGALVFANFVALTSAQQNYRPTHLINFGRQCAT